MSALLSIRDEAHHALQVVAAVGHTHLPHDDGYQFSNTGWSNAHGALVGREVSGVRAGLRLADLTWIVLRDSGGLAQLPVAGTTRGDALAWMRGVLTGAGAPDQPLELPTWDLPSHAVTEGRTFTGGTAAARGDLARAYALAHAEIGRAAEAPEASAPRCWPHHFDLATLLSLEDGDPEHAKSIGVGFTPSDGGIPEPYWYVTPWPYPEPPTGPPLPHGRWHTEGWFGAVLTSDDPAIVRAFLAAAIAACRELLA